MTTVMHSVGRAAPKNRVKLDAMITVPTITLNLTRGPSWLGIAPSVWLADAPQLMLFCCRFLLPALTIFTYSTQKQSRNWIRVFSVSVETGRETERETGRKFYIQPSRKRTLRKKIYKHIKKPFSQLSSLVTWYITWTNEVSFWYLFS